MKTVLTSGAFDLIHYGHIRLLEEAKRLGGPDARLVVIVARDETIHRLKGLPPVIPEDQRRAVVEALKVVDEALLGYETLDMATVIDRVKPDIIAVGYDQDSISRTEMCRWRDIFTAREADVGYNFSTAQTAIRQVDMIAL